MRFTLDREDLFGAVSKIRFALETKDTIEAYENIAMRISGSNIRLTSSNRIVDVEASVSITESLPETSFGVSGKELYTISSMIPSGKIQFTLDGRLLHVKGGRSKIRLPILSRSEFDSKFPSKTNYQSDLVSYSKLDMKQFLISLDKVNHCVDADHHRRELAAVFINEQNFYASDGYRIAVYPNNVIDLSGGKTMLLHALQIPKILKVFKGLNSDGGVNIQRQEKIHLQCSGIYMGASLMMGKRSDYEGVLPKGGSSAIEFNSGDMLDVIRRAISFCERERGRDIIRVEIEEGVLTVSSSSLRGSFNESFDCSHSMSGCFNVNGVFLSEALFKLEKETALMILHHENELVKFIEIKEGEYRNVILTRS